MVCRPVVVGRKVEIRSRADPPEQFFSLFSIMGKASSFVGPIISSAIIDASPSQNASTPFYFLFGLSLASLILLIGFLDVPASKREQRLFLEYEAKRSMELDQ